MRRKEFEGVTELFLFYAFVYFSIILLSECLFEILVLMHFLFTALLDNPPAIRVHGLASNQKVTLWNQFIDDFDLEFSSHAHYIADRNGTVDVKNHLSLGGKYTGIFPEGLVACLHAAPPVYKEKAKLKWARLFKKDVTKPMKVRKYRE